VPGDTPETSVWGGPPLTETFFSLLSWTKPMNSLSGDQKNWSC
jgi:hypothetical protein